jgi:TetR/AcrR family transcriptional regulator
MVKKVIHINLRFLELPDSKQWKIINAGFEVFAKSEYKRASTEEIAEKAGISKGILFYYFHDKKTFYAFLFEQAVSKVKEYVIDENIEKIDDFFELSAYAAERKYKMLSESPYIMDFIMRAFYAKRETLPENINKKFQEEPANIFGTYFSRIDFSKFRDDTDPEEIFHMITWMVEGYLHERQRSGESVALDEIMEKFRHWSAYFKRMSYKEEYLK